MPPEKPPSPPVAISRPNFVELCRGLTVEDEKAFEELWRRLGLSVDWTTTYTTIGERAQRVSQRAFLHLLEKGLAYQAEAPTLWDVDFQTAVAQAELEDREVASAYHRLRFGGPDGRPIEIDTTRPELVGACVALVAHPDDARFKKLFGAWATTPVFHVPVPILAHTLADPEKGTGVAMVCTFGDVTDVQWWRELDLPMRTMLGRDGRVLDSPPSRVPAARWEALRGKSVNQARTAMIQLLRESGEVVGEPRAITHPVKFFEKGSRPLEIVTSRQWFIRTLEHRDEFGRPRPAAALAPALHAGPLRGLGERAQPGLAGQPPAVLRRAVPALVPGAGRRHRRPRPSHRRRRGPAARRPVHRRPLWVFGRAA